MKLYGTITSPYVRRVKVVASMLGVEHEIVDTATEAGQQALLKVSPIWKVPVATVGSTQQIVFDSRGIIAYLLETHGHGRLHQEPADALSRIPRENILHAIDAALDSAISVFYLRREGLDVDPWAYTQRQRARVDAIFAWLGDELSAGRFGGVDGLAELSLCCTLDWMMFRNTYPVASLGGRFDHVRARFERWPEFAASAPR